MIAIHVEDEVVFRIMLVVLVFVAMPDETVLVHFVLIPPILCGEEVILEATSRVRADIWLQIVKQIFPPDRVRLDVLSD